MALCYDIKCDNCNAEFFEVSDYLSLDVEGESISIAHPGESKAIEAYGLSFDEAAVSGRLH